MASSGKGKYPHVKINVISPPKVTKLFGVKTYSKLDSWKRQIQSGISCISNDDEDTVSTHKIVFFLIRTIVSYKRLLMTKIDLFQYQ